MMKGNLPPVNGAFASQICMSCGLEQESPEELPELGELTSVNFFLSPF